MHHCRPPFSYITVYERSIIIIIIKINSYFVNLIEIPEIYPKPKR